MLTKHIFLIQRLITLTFLGILVQFMPCILILTAALNK